MMKTVLLVAAVCCFAAAAPVASQAADAPPASLIQAAKAEGKLTLYSVGDRAMYEPVSKAFKDKYGIEVETVRLVSAQIAQRFSAEAQSGKVVADIVITSDQSLFDQGMATGLFLKMNADLIPGYPVEAPAWSLFADGADATVAIIPQKLAFNTDSIKAADAPKTWAALADPKYKDGLLIADPGSAANYTKYWLALLAKYGEDNVKKMGANVSRTFASQTEQVNALGAGEGDVALFVTASTVQPLIGKGAHMALGDVDYVVAGEYRMGVAAKSPHPSAARLFAYYLLTGEGQAKYATHESGSVGPAVPADQALLREYKPFPEVTPADVTRVKSLLGLR